MSFVYLPEAAADCSQPNTSSGSARSAMSRSMTTASRSSSPESATGCSTTPQSGTTLEHSTGDPGADAWISSLLGSRASRSRRQGKNKASKTSETCGLKPCEYFAKFDPDTLTLKMSQGLLFPVTTAASSRDWPKAGLMLDGTVYPLVRSVPTSLVTEYGSQPRVPRPTACDGKGSGRIRWERVHGGGMNLRDWFNWKYNMVYPPANMAEYLMGWPLGWTDLEPLETAKFRLWLQQHGGCSQIPLDAPGPKG